MTATELLIEKELFGENNEYLYMHLWEGKVNLTYLHLSVFSLTGDNLGDLGNPAHKFPHTHLTSWMDGWLDLNKQHPTHTHLISLVRTGGEEKESERVGGGGGEGLSVWRCHSLVLFSLNSKNCGLFVFPKSLCGQHHPHYFSQWCHDTHTLSLMNLGLAFFPLNEHKCVRLKCSSHWKSSSWGKKLKYRLTHYWELDWLLEWNWVLMFFIGLNQESIHSCFRSRFRLYLVYNNLWNCIL